MFGRTRAAEDVSPTHTKEGGKGHATPTRKDAQAAAKQRARTGLDPKANRKQIRDARAAHSQKVRQGMRSGDERFLMERDKGPVKRFVRDYVDSRLSFMEFLLPVLVVIMVLQFTRVQSLMQLSNGLWTASIVLLLVDVALLNFRLGREIKRRFPDGDTRGWRFYALMRSIQLRVLRMPKPQRKVREKLPDRY
ncbi:DUF3043 domain-containing protein [Nocardioides mangrovicus]|uniref:DUF3043 domain-containing protein n=1 Tax=Nocardioides mangrovicus TaxID=2478913 RepID=UPI0013141504|nr:DUF3043 domain-containing protein [Nocardioides mangrovicus]